MNKSSVWMILLIVFLGMGCIGPFSLGDQVPPARPQPVSSAISPAVPFVTPTNPPQVVVLPTKIPTATRQPAPTPTVKPPETPQATTVDKITIDYVYTEQVITAIYHLYGTLLDDYLVVTIENENSKKVTVVVTSEIVGYTNKAIDTVDIAPGDSYEIRQNPRLVPEAIDKLNAAKKADFHIRVDYLENGQPRNIVDQTDETIIFARRDFPWTISGFTQQEVFELLPAMVTPNDPSVEKLIRAAADYNSDKIMTSGYGGVENDKEGKVWRRLEAIYKAMADTFKIIYISTWVSYAPGDVQRIRLPAEVIDQKSGNCIELAFLFASAAEALDLETAIILIPGHAYVAVRTDMKNAKYYFVETTLVGRNSFSQATTLGSKEWDDARPHLDKKDKDYGFITVQDMRKKGILPIPWR